MTHSFIHINKNRHIILSSSQYFVRSTTNNIRTHNVLFLIPLFMIKLHLKGKFRREFVSVLERCRCNNREIHHHHHSCYFNAAGTRLNTISPNSRSLCHFVSHRERNKSFREKNVSNLMN